MHLFGVGHIPEIFVKPVLEDDSLSDSIMVKRLDKILQILTVIVIYHRVFLKSEPVSQNPQFHAERNLLSTRIEEIIIKHSHINNRLFPEDTIRPDNCVDVTGGFKNAVYGIVERINILLHRKYMSPGPGK